ncbi:hypothetical protein [Altererythrobacter sp. Root672]|uniref:hypothetical protein n=1 Tax=Altererythrobacter sp. Root672 TaxID=1736584 RepID=UPI0006FDDB89|nr:hypothetical protein [Altererythrobacter sp. Root672]KRA82873.1 hypothetical protein ASD76_01915 [Altererythrobacter sp. Root672]
MSHSANLGESLRQMFALLEAERQALAAIDLERIITCADGKMNLCDAIEGRGAELDEESRGVLDAVLRLNDVNRKLRNLIASNVQTRLTALSGGSPLYDARRGAKSREITARA